MSALLAKEVERLTRDLGYVISSSQGYAAEVPIRIHDRGTDAGHGLGGPKFSAEFLRWITTGSCSCKEPPVNGTHEDTCYRDSPTRMGRSSHRSHPRRLHRALRHLRAVSPIEFDPVYLILARGFSWRDALEKINTDRGRRGQEPHSEADFTVLTIAGISKICERF
jgi:hypothetical protein